MKYILNVAVPVEDETVRRYLAMAQALTITSDGAHTTLTKFLCGENPWGFHQDLRFAGRPSQIRQGLRIMQAAEDSIEKSLPYIVLADDDYALLAKSVELPHRNQREMPMPAALGRAILPFIEAIENATDTAPVLEGDE